MMDLTFTFDSPLWIVDWQASVAWGSAPGEGPVRLGPRSWLYERLIYATENHRGTRLLWVKNGSCDDLVENLRGTTLREVAGVKEQVLEILMNQ
jgi:hypothetical protein